MDKVSLYVPFQKKDNDEKIVAGYASTEALDSQGETVKIKAIEKALPEYMKYGNIREMHQWSAVGKTVQAKIDETKKGLHIVARVIDGTAWEKCKEGVYNGFSIGGKVVKKVNNAIEELSLNEISLVDRPANPEAVFSVVKFDTKAAPPTAPSGMAEGEMENENVLVSDKLSQVASSLVFLIDHRKGQGHDVKHLERILKDLKAAIVKELAVDKLAKKEEEDKKEEKVATQAQEIKDMLVQQQKGQQIQDPNWAEPYFDQHKEVL